MYHDFVSRIVDTSPSRVSVARRQDDFLFHGDDLLRQPQVMLDNEPKIGEGRRRLGQKAFLEHATEHGRITSEPLQERFYDMLATSWKPIPSTLRLASWVTTSPGLELTCTSCDTSDSSALTDIGLSRCAKAKVD